MGGVVHESGGVKMFNKILVVDYSVLRQQMYALVMKRDNCTVVSAANSQQALELLAVQDDIELVLLDINIAGTSGLEFLEKISALGILTRLPVILINPAGREEEARQGIKIGARESLVRPFNPIKLHEIIEKIFIEEKVSKTYKEISCQQEGAVMAIPERKIVSERVYWRGVLTQSMSLDLGGELLKALKESDSLTVNLEGVERLDYSCLVLLCAVKRQAEEKAKEICLEGIKNPAVAPLIQRFRVNGNQLCRAYCGNSCLFD